MKKFAALFLALLMIVPMAAMAEAIESPSAEDFPFFSEFPIVIPEGAVMEETEDNTYVVTDGTVIVEAAVLTAELTGEPEEFLTQLLTQLAPNAEQRGVINLIEGYTAILAVRADQFGPGIDEVIALVISDNGNLLVLSAYDIEGDTAKAEAVLNYLLAELLAE